MTDYAVVGLDRILAFLKPYDRERVKLAYQLFVKSAEELPAFRFWALYHAARSKCAEGRVFKDATCVEEGRALLTAIPERAKAAGIRLPSDLARRIESEKAGCGG